jgi:hypothetical protein
LLIDHLNTSCTRSLSAHGLFYMGPREWGNPHSTVVIDQDLAGGMTKIL